MKYPPYRDDYDDKKGLWRPIKRHDWLKENLVFLRRFQAANKGTQFRDLYTSLIRDILPDIQNTFSVGNGNVKIWEIISDGLAFIEPNWNGFEVQADGSPSNLTEEYLDMYKNRIRDERNKNVQTRYDTHIAIGEQIISPTLFLISSTSVFYFDKGQWKPVSDNNFCFRLKIRENPVEMQDSSLVEKDHAFCKTLMENIRQSSYVTDQINDIEQSLKKISEQALWPALLNSRNETGEYLSLVLINASTWQVPGVWAMHICLKHKSVNRSLRPVPSESIYELIEPPLQCINDVLGATFGIEGQRNEKLKMVWYYNQCQGARITLEELQKAHRYSLAEIEIYETDWPKDPFDKFCLLYEKVTEGFRIGLPHVSTSQFQHLDIILKYGFVVTVALEWYYNFAILLLKELVEKIENMHPAPGSRVGSLFEAIRNLTLNHPGQPETNHCNRFIVPLVIDLLLFVFTDGRNVSSLSERESGCIENTFDMLLVSSIEVYRNSETAIPDTEVDKLVFFTEDDYFKRRRYWRHLKEFQQLI